MNNKRTYDSYQLYYHIYFNDNKEEIKNKYEINKEDKVTKIKIIIDYQVKSLKELFSWCECIESINFKNFYRNNVKYLFLRCILIIPFYLIIIYKCFIPNILIFRFNFFL